MGHARRLAAAALCLLAALAAAPAAAGAQSLSEDGCRDATGARAACVGLAKLGERVSAECRRAGLLGDEACWSRVGRRVVAAEIDAYEGSWTSRVLRFQSALGDEVPFARAPWVGTHNANNDTAEAPTLSHTDSNQQVGLRDQLRMDVRSLELDVHWIPSARAGGAFAPVLCHGQGGAGCTTERLLGERLAEVAAWLDEHPGEVLLLYLEDQIDDPGGYAASAAVVREVLGDRLYAPRGGGCRNLPLDLTRRAVRDAGAQVVVVGDCGEGAWQAVSHAWPSSVRFESRPRAFDCATSVPADAPSRIVRFFEDSTFLSAAAAPTGAASVDDGLTPATVRAMIACGVDLLGFDQLLPRDGRLDALVWSWADGEAWDAAAPGTCTVQGTDGRWRLAACDARHHPACVAPDGAFTVEAMRVPRTAAASVCADRGLALATPRTATENAALRAAAGERAVWLAHRAG
jgi:hypothetical protein